MIRANIVIFDKGGVWMGDFYVYNTIEASGTAQLFPVWMGDFYVYNTIVLPKS
ncbi:MAG: hypothetical protein KH897_14000 [Bacteroides sp.]|uniref:hypothetical protein n=1 Tax=Bacteroides sp. TaxID=29523 RepID=UPI0025C3D7CE|nr:hypothetical protein [Bacteroides sp.]MBS6239437.1 hypothetical protein [Bacteroides sp.]